MKKAKEISTIKELSLTINDSSTLYFKNKFNKSFDIEKLILDFYGLDVIDESEFYAIKYSYSYDNISWSNPVSRDKWNYNNSADIESNNTQFFVSVSFTKFETDLENDNTPKRFREEKTKLNDAILTLNSIKYDNKIIDITDENQISLVNLHKVIEKYPKWNFYEGQNVTLQRWLDQLVSVTQMYGHVAIYFKTEVTEVNDTLSNNYSRKVSQIKKILFTTQNNTFPSIKNVYSEWDYNTDEEFMIEIVDTIFKNSFGENKVPLPKDYIYIPIINKMWSLNSVQPKLGFMGKTGIWDVGLFKYEKDETIKMDKELVENYSEFEDFSMSMDFFGEMEEFNLDTEFSQEKIEEKTIQEKKEVTDNLSNRFKDSTDYTDIRETDAQREFFAKRLNIVSISPNESLFPITMYDANEVNVNVVALTYNILDLISVNKFSNVSDELEISYDFVLTKRFNGDLLSIHGMNNVSLFQIKMDRQKFCSVVLPCFEYTRKLNYEFTDNEFYGVHFKFIELSKQLSVVVYQLINGIKQNVFQDLVILPNKSPNKMQLNLLYLYGGNHFISNIKCLVNKNEILNDKCNPVLLMQNKHRN